MIALILAASLFGLGYAPGLEVEVIKVVDGDTMRVHILNRPDCPPIFCRNIPVRFLGIDTPEIRGKCHAEKILATKAREFVRKLVEGAEEIRLREVSRGKFFRLLARPFVKTKAGEWVDIVQELIDARLGRPYEGGRREPWCPPS
ncbi:MAG: thermonuclease family protein [Nitrospinota bacterium]